MDAAPPNGRHDRTRVGRARILVIFRTGVEAFDRLAEECPAELQAFLAKVRASGWIGKETDKLSSGTIAYFLPRKGRFYYHPGRLSILDLWHEAKHLELFERRGDCKPGSGQADRDEIEVYWYEYELGKQHGFSAEYMRRVESRIAYHERRLRGPEAVEDARPFQEAARVVTLRSAEPSGSFSYSRSSYHARTGLC